MSRLTAAEAVAAFTDPAHADLGHAVDHIHEIACELDAVRLPMELPTHLLGVLDWFDEVLEPRLTWEESWLYPRLDRRVGTHWATRSAQFDHLQIRVLVERLREDRLRLREGPSVGVLAELRGHLFALESLIRAHLERESRFLAPLTSGFADSPVATATSLPH